MTYLAYIVAYLLISLPLAMAVGRLLRMSSPSGESHHHKSYYGSVNPSAAPITNRRSHLRHHLSPSFNQIRLRSQR